MIKFSGAKLKAMMLKRNMTPILAQRAAYVYGADLSRSNIYYHQKEIFIPKIETISLYAKILNCKIEDLLEGNWELPKKREL